jgi:hypothetical protein
VCLNRIVYRLFFSLSEGKRCASIVDTIYAIRIHAWGRGEGGLVSIGGAWNSCVTRQHEDTVPGLPPPRQSDRIYTLY